MKDRIELLQESQSMRTKAGRREALRAYDLSLVRGVLVRVAGDVPVTPAQKLAREMLDMLKLEEPSRS